MKNDCWICSSSSLGVSRRSVMSLLKCALAFLLVVSFIAVPAFGQENTAAKPEAPDVPKPSEGEIAQPKDLSLYGEVQAVDPAANSIMVQYYNYDTDEEKTMEITFDKDTKIENAGSLADIKKGDWVDVTYVAGGGKFIAGSVIVEREEAIVEESAKPSEAPEEPAEE